jgi:hypothetical protein
VQADLVNDFGEELDGGQTPLDPALPGSLASRVLDRQRQGKQTHSAIASTFNRLAVTSSLSAA